MSTKPRQIQLFALLFIGVFALIAVLWFFVVRTEYVPVYENIRERDAAKIVEELDKAGVAYKLENDGHDILVPNGEAAKARVAVAGSNIAMGGTTGFELFNENELGLTEFTQKINLQRAIQGELARTIMMMDGIEFARVHLALPERTLFRSEQETPTAAVTVEMKTSQRLTSARVEGIRQLVASSVPGLTVQNVALLDEAGGLVSALPPASPAYGQTGKTERDALEALITIRATEAIDAVLPNQPFELTVSAFQRVEEDLQDASDDPNRQESTNSSRSTLGLGEHALRLIVRTPQQLGPEERFVVTRTLKETIGLSSDEGDMLDFATGALSPDALYKAPGVAVRASGKTRQSSAKAWADPVGVETSITAFSWSWLAVPLLIALVALFAARPRRKLSADDAEDFAQLLRSSALDREPR